LWIFFVWYDGEFRSSAHAGNSLYRGKGMVPHVQSSTNYGLGCFKNKTKYFLCTNSHFLSGLTIVQAVDPLPLYRDFPGSWEISSNDNILSSRTKWLLGLRFDDQSTRINKFLNQPQSKFLYGPGVSFTKLTCIFDVSFRNSILWNTHSFVH
jgi:hypothetical protein